MAFVHVAEDGSATYPVNFRQWRNANKVSLRDDPPEETLAAHGLFAVEPSARPDFDPITQDLLGPIAELQPDGTWREVWTVTAAPPEAIQARLSAKRAGMVVTMRQARLALLGAGKLAAVDAALASLPSPDKEAAQINWEYATEVQRVSPLVTALAPALGLDDAALDALFEAAAGIE